MTFVSRGTLSVVFWAAVGCTGPQSGIFESDWCQPQMEGADEMVDDMEDGDGVPCTRKGRWSAGGMGSITPSGDISRAVELPDPAVEGLRALSQRALHLSGVLDAGGSATLALSFGKVTELSKFNEVRFWARSDSGPISIRVAAVTRASTDTAQGGTCDPGLGACGDHFGDNVDVIAAWTEAPYPVPLEALAPEGWGQPAVGSDLANALGLQFRITGAATDSTTFGFWIDDIHLQIR